VGYIGTEADKEPALARLEGVNGFGEIGDGSVLNIDIPLIIEFLYHGRGLPEFAVRKVKGSVPETVKPGTVEGPQNCPVQKIYAEGLPGVAQNNRGDSRFFQGFAGGDKIAPGTGGGVSINAGFAEISFVVLDAYSLGG
jgi:hypothetical protein